MIVGQTNMREHNGNKDNLTHQYNQTLTNGNSAVSNQIVMNG